MRNTHAGLALLICMLFTTAFVACAVPDADAPPGGDVDAAPPDDPDGGGESCEQPVTSVPSGNHNAGQACMTCHGPAGPGPRWQVAGTLYTSASSTTPLVGATITITDANNRVTKLVTGTNGNFYSGATFAFPVRVHASRCPDSRQMGEAAPNGNCNSCHQPGGVGRIHLP